MTTKKLLTLNSCSEWLMQWLQLNFGAEQIIEHKHFTSHLTTQRLPTTEMWIRSTPEDHFQYPGIQVSRYRWLTFPVIAMIINRSLLTAVRPTVSYHTRPYFDWLSLARVCSIGSNPSKDDPCVHLVSALLTWMNIIHIKQSNTKWLDYSGW